MIVGLIKVVATADTKLKESRSSRNHRSMLELSWLGLRMWDNQDSSYTKTEACCMLYVFAVHNNYAHHSHLLYICITFYMNCTTSHVHVLYVTCNLYMYTLPHCMYMVNRAALGTCITSPAHSGKGSGTTCIPNRSPALWSAVACQLRPINY